MLKPIYLDVEFSPGIVRFSRTDRRQVPAELDKDRSLRDRVRDLLLTAGERTTAEIAEELDAPENQVRARLADFKDKEFVVTNPEAHTPRWGVLQR